jgi:hypothetical protein
VVVNTSGSLVFSITDKPLAAVGLRDTVIIQTDTGLLVSQMRETQKVKQVSALWKKRRIRHDNRGGGRKKKSRNDMIAVSEEEG